MYTPQKSIIMAEAAGADAPVDIRSLPIEQLNMLRKQLEQVKKRARIVPPARDDAT